MATRARRKQDKEYASVVATVFWIFAMWAVGTVAVRTGLIGFIDSFYGRSQLAFWTLFVVSRVAVFLVWLVMAMLFAEIAYKIGFIVEDPHFFSRRIGFVRYVSGPKVPLVAYALGIFILLVLMAMIEMGIYGYHGMTPAYMPLLNQIFMESPQ